MIAASHAEAAKPDPAAGILNESLGAYDVTVVHAYGELSYVHDLGGVVEPFLGVSMVRASAEEVRLVNNREGFAVRGPGLSANAAVIQAGARWRMSEVVTLDAAYDGVIGEGSDHMARVGVSLRF